jgi:two-component system response regulator DesR
MTVVLCGRGDPLTERELEVLERAALGDTAVDTARCVFLAPETVKMYRRRIMRKLGARNMMHAVAIAVARGHVPAGALVVSLPD